MIELQKTDKTLSDMPPLTWRWWSNDDPEKGGVGTGIVVMRDGCPNTQFAIDEGGIAPTKGHHLAFLNMQPNPWNIADDGTVTPSVHFLDCGWHDYVKLIGWETSDDHEGDEA